MTHNKITRRQVLRGMTALGATALVGCSRLSRPDDKAGEAESNSAPDATGTPMPSGTDWNFIIVMCDTLRYDHVGFYGNAHAQTPNIDAFAAESLVFDKAYAGGFPTLINRAELFTGRYTFTYMGWEDMHDGETVLAQVLNDAGYTTAIIFDTWHLVAHDTSFDREFGSSQWIRGQEDDRYRATPLWPKLPAAADKFRYSDAVRQYLRNVSERQTEADYFVAQTMQAAIDWLRENHDQNKFFLHVDSFDPHEPWDPPQSYVDMYDPGYVGEEVIYPAYAPPDYLTADELSHTQALYAAEVTLMDHWLGKLVAEIENLGLLDNTVVILASDHGIFLGEHDSVGKKWDYKGYTECYPLYEELVHIPLMIRAPGMGHRRISDLVQPADLMPTILEWAGAGDPGTMHGHSLVPMLEDATGSSHTPPRSFVISSRSWYIPLSTKLRCTITDGAWTLIYGGTHAPSELYYLPDDPQQQTDLLNDQRDTARRLHAELVPFLKKAGLGEEYIAPWRSAPC